MTAPQGWYRSTDGQQYERWWDGTRWTEYTRPISEAPPTPPRPSPSGAATAPLPGMTPAAPTPPLPQGSSAASYQPTGNKPSKPFYRRGWFIGVAVLVALIVIGSVAGALGSNSSSSTASSDESSAPAAAAPPASKTPSTTATSATAPRTSTRPRPSKTTHHKSAASGDGSFRMPNEVGKNLQAAQDDVQRVSKDPVFFTHSRDLLGDRFQLFDRDWQVCTQNVSPGTRASAVEHIVFGVVKIDENCP